ncbi:hypothetical protein [Streptomyces brasiliensis]|nr:hypothetical protein [Streptomyces brasiliensis]
MDLTRTPEHEQLAETVRRLVAAGDPLCRARRALDDGDAVDDATWKQLVGLGVLDAAACHVRPAVLQPKVQPKGSDDAPR